MRRDEDYLRDILTAAELIQVFIEGLTREDFASDLKTQAAVIREIEIIGEAARQCSDDFRSSHPAVPWPDVVGMRNVLAHAYHGVVVDEVWLAATRDVPELVRELS
jgi:uncharacterized protein with HEPN domain